ncbi:hypothetical protein [Serratia rubidaea]|uniref:Uncharacterized protein n=1 Tax=Serratia rubidaea TaxID=61652 RepID=A0A3S5F298_SERRU|nr:hypothetical protein [Serratia rubidaea]VEI69243.1 Uncharacterised protein [Serratia rubidaea]
MIDPRTPSGKLTLRYRGLPNRHLMTLLGIDPEDTDRPYYTRDQLIGLLVDKGLNDQLRQAVERLGLSTENKDQK